MLWSGLLCVGLSALAGAITCPDGGACADGSACCRTGSGSGSRYGCCPRSLPMVRASAGNDRNDTVCANGSRCPSEYSCLKSHGLYECCPLPQGVSCSDGKHCCPEHHQCGEDGHTCIEAKAVQALGETSEVKVTSVTCPDGRACPDQNTCCQLRSGSYGCCPYPDAVCCSDQLHCCPSGTTCDLEHNTCQSADSRTSLARTNPTSSDVGDVPCDSTHACPDGATCCKTAGGDWACCPLPEAVCCDDHTHCCPKDTTCDTAAGRCNDGMRSVPWLEKVPSLTHRPNNEGNVSCDSTHACPDGTTCCKTAEGDWACCPLPEAVCCDDHTHCCPKDTTCDTAAGTCNDGMRSVPWLEKVPSLTHRPNKEGNVPCDSTHACPDGTTCCKTAGGDWACCPLPEAVCCDDHTHCCPKDTTCDTAAGTCNDGMRSVPWLEKVPSLTHRPNKEGNVPCDSTHACPDGTTCCKTAGGDWACCPLPEAVCCDDHTHCCPKDTTCDTAAGTCNDGMRSVPWLEKVPSLTHRPNKEGNVPCDSTHSCPDGTTCCKTAGGDWACCPLPQAVCCDDHTHCCPKDTTCDTAAGRCNDGMRSVPWLEKVPSLTHRPNKEGNVPCDSTHSCPDGTTCCKTAGGDWACCPLPEAVCCDDHTHCCPKDTTCDTAAGTCNDGMRSVPWLEKVPSLTHRPNKEGNVPCNSTHACPDGTTCCKTAGGDWACCPLPQAVCCDDHTHCCPKDTTCDTAAGTCNDGMRSVPWLEKVPSLTHRPNKEGNVPCNSTHACPDGTTCCKTAGGDWACCPLPQAVCCYDHIHCCPKDTTCDTAAGTCNDGMRSVPWLEKVPSLTHRPNKEGNVPCDSTHACPDGTTCCKTAGGDWACCPLPEAVCCDDHIHCCPKDTTCDTAAGRCNDGMRSVPWLEKVPSLTHRPNKEGNVPCNSTHACPDGTTCCKTAGGDWACCPLPEAVCCDDHIHCCPKGTTCNLAASTCDDGMRSVPWLEKVPALSRMHRGAKMRAPQLQKVPCDATVRCPDSNTCCFMKSLRRWGCCPLPNAVCCADGTYCCPSGYTCGPTARSCSRSGEPRWDSRLFRRRL
ncbi:progranulin-like isoform X3 [Anguilla anguilla]|uniref:progranulin-like isoform X3 n=1 Tax=Anguilla anguilla TaxID=7936 RepID=UPI0015AA215C|nr:progranulin-like isoform X3 [Anguilla anguilla]